MGAVVSGSLTRPSQSARFYLPTFLVVTLAVAAFFTTHIPLTPKLANVSSTAVLLFALPAYVAVVRYWGWRRGGLILLVLGVYALLVETTAVTTGWPYGSFVYGNTMGLKVGGAVPWTVPFAWTPLILATVPLGQRLSMRPWMQVVASGLWLMVTDLVLDPAAVALHFWTWQEPGYYYQIPFQNFVGWLGTGTLGSVIAFVLMREPKSSTQQPQSDLLPMNLATSAMAIMFFWTLVCIFLELWMPAAFGFLTLFLLLQWWLLDARTT